MTQHGLVNMCIWARAEESEMKTIANLTNAFFFEAKRQLRYSVIFFFCGHVVPTILQILIENVEID